MALREQGGLGLIVAKQRVSGRFIDYRHTSVHGSWFS
jgi:hypothetical protein